MTCVDKQEGRQDDTRRVRHDPTHYPFHTLHKQGRGNITVNVKRNIMKKFLLNQYAALKVIFTHLVTLDTLLGISLTLLCTLYVHFYWMDDARDYSMNWFLLSFATIIPMGVR